MDQLNDKKISKKLHSSLRVQEYGKKPTIDGVKLVELPTFSDDGGYFLELSRFTTGYLNEFADFELKQMNFSEMLPGVIKATHLHYQQEDIWFIPPSHRLLVGLMDVRNGSSTEGVTMRLIMGAGKARLLYIPRGVAHGAANLWSKPAAIIYWVNNEFNPAPDDTDEHRLPWDVFGHEFWTLSKE